MDDSSAEGFFKSDRWGVAASLAPSEAFARTQAVLDHFGVPRAPESGPFFEVMQGGQTAEGYAAVARLMDPQGFFAQFTSGTPGALRVFQDAQSRGVMDYDYRFGSSGLLSASPSHGRLIQAARNNSAARPLAGLRVALDPGHMGGDDWDRHSGKFVHDHRGHKLSEGTMALQISLLLEKDLTALGAEVMITHREQGPVTDVAYAGMDLKPYALQELAETTQAPWFQRQIQAAPAGPALFAAFAANASFRALFDPGFYNHDTYFMLPESRMELLSLAMDVAR
jgi:N-acetylmuramoyl-L-alanine amidase